MRYIYLVLMLLLCLSALAQETENGASASLICQTETAYHVQVVAYGNAEIVYINPSRQDVIVWNIGSEKAITLDIGLGNETVGLVIYADGGAFYGATLLLTQAASCKDKPDIPTMDIEKVKNAVLSVLGVMR